MIIHGINAIYNWRTDLIDYSVEFCAHGFYSSAGTIPPTPPNNCPSLLVGSARSMTATISSIVASTVTGINNGGCEYGCETLVSIV